MERVVKINGFECWQVKDEFGRVILQYVYTARNRRASWSVPTKYPVKFRGYTDYWAYKEFKV